mgnify:CR=1 FL=1
MSVFYIELILIITALTAAIIEAKVDASKKRPEHAISAAVRSIVCFGLSWWLVGSWFLFPVILLTCYWIIFDPAYNTFKKGWQNRFYIGRTSFLDKTARKICGEDGLSYLMLKLLILGVFSTIYYI